MANTHVFETKMADRMQITRYSDSVYNMLASFEERKKLERGQSVTRPYVGRFYEQDYTRGSDLTIPDYTETNETLTVQTSKAAPFAIDDLDAMQSNFRLLNEYSGKAMRALNKSIDAAFLGEVVDHATTTIDAGDVGGVAGSPIDLDTSNVTAVFAASLRALGNLNVEITGKRDPRPNIGNMKPGGSGGYAVVNPWFNETLGTALAGRETADGDQKSKTGYVRTYMSFDNYLSTNLAWTGILGMATNPTDSDTVVINGVTVTFVATLSGATSEIHIASTVDITRANFCTWLSAGGANAEVEGVDTGYSAASADDQNLLLRMTATNDNTADTATIVAEGYSYVVVSETFTDPTDTWTTEKSHQMFGEKGAVDMVVRKEPSVKISDIPLQLGVYVKPHTLFGLQTFTEGRNALVNVEINSANWA